MKNRYPSPLALAALLLVAATAHADEEPGWSDTAELSFVATGGNAESSSLGFKNTLTRRWEISLFTLHAAGVRIESKGDDFAVGDPVNFVVVEPSKETTAENYKLDGRFHRKISDRLYWHTGAGWDRNRFSGVDNRYSAQGGVGNIWRDSEDLKFRTDYAVTYTRQEDTDGTENDFGGLRFSWTYLNEFGQSTTYENRLILDENLDETDDFRADMTNSVAVSMTERLALKVSLQLLYDNMPSFTDLELFDPAGAPTGTTVSVELDELDTVFTTSLVVDF